MTDFDRIEVIPAPNRYFDEYATTAARQSLPGQSTAARELAYAQRAAAYKAGLKAEYTRLRFGPRRSQAYPEHPVHLPGRTETVVYDTTLNRQLLQIYLVDGWPGIQTVQKALGKASTDARSKALHPWPYATSFFGFTRNLLALSIRDALIEIERKAADRLVLELGQSAELVNSAWTGLDIRVSDKNAQGQPEYDNELVTPEDAPGAPPVLVAVGRKFYTFGKRERSEKLLLLVNRAVQARSDLAAQIRKRDYLQWQEEVSRRETDAAMPYGMQADLEQVHAWLAAQEGAVDDLYADVHAECPLALLAVPLLALPLTREAMEQTIGECLARFRGKSERIAAAYAMGTSRVARTIPGEQPGRSPELLYDADFAPEATVVDAVLAGAGQDAGLLALLSEQLLRLLVDSGQVPFDSFEYMVLMHYLTALQAALIEERKRIEFLNRLIATVGALVSIALWVVPAGRVASGVSTVLGISVISYYTYSVVHQLTLLDRQLDQKFTELDRHSATQIVALTELAQMRSGYLKEVTESVLQEISMMVAAGALPMFRHLLHIRGVYLDLEALIGT